MTPSLFCWSCIRSAGLREEKATFSSGLFLGLTVTCPVSPRQSSQSTKTVLLQVPSSYPVTLRHLVYQEPQSPFSMKPNSIWKSNENWYKLNSSFIRVVGDMGHTTKQAKQLPSSYHSDSYWASCEVPQTCRHLCSCFHTMPRRRVCIGPAFHFSVFACRGHDKRESTSPSTTPPIKPPLSENTQARQQVYFKSQLTQEEATLLHRRARTKPFQLNISPMTGTYVRGKEAHRSVPTVT